MPGCGVPMLDHDDLMSFEELTEVVAASARLGVRKVRLTGGEPLVRQDVVELVRMIAAVPGIEEVDMTTNGTLLAPLAAPLREAGLTRVNVSLDTLDPVLYRKITRVGRLEDALAGLAALERAGATFEDGADGAAGNKMHLTKSDLYELGLSGRADSAARRCALLRALKLPENLSANRLLDVLNATVTEQEFAALLHEGDRFVSP
jgi:hypothetical protein